MTTAFLVDFARGVRTEYLRLILSEARVLKVRRHHDSDLDGTGDMGSHFPAVGLHVSESLRHPRFASSQHSQL